MSHAFTMTVLLSSLTVLLVLRSVPISKGLTVVYKPLYLLSGRIILSGLSRSVSSIGQLGSDLNGLVLLPLSREVVDFF